MEVCCDLVEGLAPSLWYPEECEDEKEQKECCEDQEDVGPAKVLRKDAIGLRKISRSRTCRGVLIDEKYLQRHIGSTCQR